MRVLLAVSSNNIERRLLGRLSDLGNVYTLVKSDCSMVGAESVLKHVDQINPELIIDVGACVLKEIDTKKVGIFFRGTVITKILAAQANVLNIPLIYCKELIQNQSNNLVITDSFPNREANSPDRIAEWYGEMLVKGMCNEYSILKVSNDFVRKKANSIRLRSDETMGLKKYFISTSIDNERKIEEIIWAIKIIVKNTLLNSSANVSARIFTLEAA